MHQCEAGSPNWPGRSPEVNRRRQRHGVPRRRRTAIIPDWGKSQLPSLRAATDAGVKTVPWAADPGGKTREDYVQYLDWDNHAAGVTWSEWIAKAIHGEGNVVFMGGRRATR